jgi:hypothetical protein
MDRRLQASYRKCGRNQRRHDPTYYCATRCLPRDVRSDIHAVYGFVRAADQIVDGPGPPAGERRHAALDAWQSELERSLSAGRSDHPVIAGLVDVGSRHGCPCTFCPITSTRCAATATSRSGLPRTSSSTTTSTEAPPRWDAFSQIAPKCLQIARYLSCCQRPQSRDARPPEPLGTCSVTRPQRRPCAGHLQ